MKTPTPFLTLLCSLLLLASCATFHKVENPTNHVALTPENLSALNGTYLTDTLAIMYHNDILWGKTSFFNPEMHQTVKNKPLYATLKVVNSKKINVRLHTDDSLTLKTYDIKGKIKNGYFLQRQKFVVVPAIFINKWYSGRFRLGLLSNQNVSTQYHTKDFGTVYFFAPYNNSEKPKAIEHFRE
ncbi:hypothetical protein MG290_03120 [Flavobacterium sp. CBA20B-1]|uniref:hypothetical protein n=1 Tax=unclassified Flavobacterium TaxID=196869 RepID=UPI0022240053|nr:MULTISPECIES: hypothetical protein [unclassified Flavobacterium]WCM42684.1 hypothetical protein MG290_03120 [Flavobacterium sp. CBA20B-1]